MLIHCPKCGFQQPQDQYCARCGVDILNYKPNSIDSSRKAVSRSGIIQILFFVILVASISFFIGKSDHEQKWVTQLRGLPSVVKTTTAASSSMKTEMIQKTNSQIDPSEMETSDSAPEIQIAVDNQEQLNRFTGEDTNPIENKTEDSIAKSNSKAETATSLNPDINIYFVEVSKPLLARWIQEAQTKNAFQNFPEFSAGILHTSTQSLEKQIKKLKSEGSQVQAGKVFSFLSGKSSEDGSDFLGFQTQIEIKTLENQTIKGQFILNKTTRQNKDQFAAELELQKGTTFFLIPKNGMTGFENETSLFQIRPFQILQSNDFQNTKSEFVILIGNE